MQKGEWCIDLWLLREVDFYDSVLRITEFKEDEGVVVGIEYVLQFLELSEGRLYMVWILVKGGRFKGSVG